MVEDAVQLFASVAFTVNTLVADGATTVVLDGALPDQVYVMVPVPPMPVALSVLELPAQIAVLVAVVFKIIAGACKMVMVFVIVAQLLATATL